MPKPLGGGARRHRRRWPARSTPPPPHAPGRDPSADRPATTQCAAGPLSPGAAPPRHLGAPSTPPTSPQRAHHRPAQPRADSPPARPLPAAPSTGRTRTGGPRAPSAVALSHAARPATGSRGDDNSAWRRPAGSGTCLPGTTTRHTEDHRCRRGTQAPAITRPTPARTPPSHVAASADRVDRGFRRRRTPDGRSPSDRRHRR